MARRRNRTLSFFWSGLGHCLGWREGLAPVRTMKSSMISSFDSEVLNSTGLITSFPVFSLPRVPAFDLKDLVRGLALEGEGL